jgi:hypothetical protein
MAQTHHYLFDTTTNYTDSTGSSNLTNTGSASINSSGKINQCINMNGYNANGAAYYTSNLLPTSGNFTIAFWLWSDSFDYQNNIIRIQPSVFTNGLLIQWFGKSNQLSFLDNSGGNFYVPSFTKSAWQHVIISWDGSNWQIYRNNSLLTKTGTLFSPNANTYGSITPFVIDYGSTTYNIRLDDLRIYDEAIDGTERSFIYNSGSGTQANSGGGGGGSATQLSVVTQPTRSYSTKNIATQPVVNLLTSGGTVDGAATNTVFANVVSGAGTIGGSTSVSATSGVATFSGLSITGFGPIGLGFTASGLTAAYATSFLVDIPVPVRPIRSETSGLIPTSGQLQIGELAINIADQKGYVKKADGTIATVWQAGGSSLTSGSVTSGFIGNAAVVSGSVGSGQIGTIHFSSGSVAKFTSSSSAPSSPSEGDRWYYTDDGVLLTYVNDGSSSQWVQF